MAIDNEKGGPMPGRVVHLEIPADNTESARDFWGGLFGWKFESLPGPPEYHLTQVNDQVGGGITNMEPGKRGVPLYLTVDDINDSATRVKQLGGEAGQPSPVPGSGWFAICKDTEGNEFGLWQNDPSAPAPPG